LCLVTEAYEPSCAEVRTPGNRALGTSLNPERRNGTLGLQAVSRRARSSADRRVPPTRLQEEPLGRVGGRPAEEAVVTELAGLLDRLAELGSDQAIRALLPRTGADNWAAFADGNRRGQ
jgi:hypothetical protein